MKRSTKAPIKRSTPRAPPTSGPTITSIVPCYAHDYSKAWLFALCDDGTIWCKSELGDPWSRETAAEAGITGQVIQLSALFQHHNATLYLCAVCADKTVWFKEQFETVWTNDPVVFNA